MISKKSLGASGPAVGRLGYGAMVLEGIYGATDEAQAIETLCHAIDAGMMIDTADAYGNGHNELLINKALQASAREAFIASKFGIVFAEGVSSRTLPTGWGFDLNINASRDYATRALEASLERLGVDCLDLWYVHFPDPATPIEDTVAAMAEQVQAGKVRYLGLSNVTPAQVRSAHKIHPIAAVQYEYSLWRREAEIELLPTLRELGIALVAWSPLGAGFLTGTLDSVPNEDFRLNNPKFRGENFSRNQDRFAPFSALASELQVTPAQLALAWLVHQGDDIFAIPGTRRKARIDENNAALDIALSAEHLRRIDEIAAVGTVTGETLI